MQALGKALMHSAVQFVSQGFLKVRYGFPGAVISQGICSGKNPPSVISACCRITAGENIMRDTGTPKRVPVNGRLAAAAPLRSPRSAGGVIRCVCENNVDRDLMVQCEVHV